jgi:hypothetical protein
MFWKRLVQQKQKKLNSNGQELSHPVSALVELVPTAAAISSNNTPERITSEASPPLVVTTDNIAPLAADIVAATPIEDPGAVTPIHTQQFTEHVASIGQASVAIENTQATSLHESPTTTGETDIILESIDSTNLYSREPGVYVGKSDILSSPDALEAEWRHVIRPRLVRNLMTVIGALPPSLSRAESTIEPELCMSGTICSGRPTIVLRPTIWIRCGSKACRKAVERAMADLNHMGQFPVYITQHAPRPAGAAQRPIKLSGSTDLLPEDLPDAILPVDSTPQTGSPVAEDWVQVVGNSTLRIRVQPMLENDSACGLQVHLHTSTETIYRCTIGGMVLLGDELFGLTTAHAIWDCASYVGDDTDGSSDTTKHLIYGPQFSKLDTSFNDMPAAYCSSWIAATLCAASYGSASSGANLKNLVDRDFALLRLELPQGQSVVNRYWTSDGAHVVRDITHDLGGRNVKVVCSPHHVVEARLLEGERIIIDGGGCWQTRKIRLDQPLGMCSAGVSSSISPND